ncbi:NTR domain-containing protein [Aphelenchoides besseyi]|nr:NTR domain-containing protein [Aphelenchoides besseyi]
MKFLIPALFLVVFFVVGEACKCAPITQKQAWDQADFVGRMRIVSKTTDGNVLTYTADYVDPIFKPANEVHIFVPVPISTPASSAACGVTQLEIGKDYLIAGMPAVDNEFSSPPGALPWESVNTELKKKLESG